MKTLYLAGAALAFAAAPAAADHHGKDKPDAMAEAQDTDTAPALRFVSSPVVQTTPADAGPPPDGELPICSEDAQDNCINSWEANKTGNRPLEYWPGRPASEIDGSLPATKAEYDSMAQDDADDSADPE